MTVIEWDGPKRVLMVDTDLKVSPTDPHHDRQRLESLLDACRRYVAANAGTVDRFMLRSQV